MSIDSLIEQPKQCMRTVVSIGPPGAGKTWIALNILDIWIREDFFDEYHLILPAYKFEQNGSYNFLEKYVNDPKKKINIYNAFDKFLVQRLVKDGDKIYPPGVSKPRICFLVDDATTERVNLMKNNDLLKLAVMSRHYNIMVWIIMHVSKGCIPVAVREQIAYYFIYKVSPYMLEIVYKEFISTPDFEKFAQFREYYKTYISPNDHGVLFIDRFKGKYSDDCDLVFSSLPK